jgi:hypothetical protein
LNTPIERYGAAIAKQIAQRIIDDPSQEYRASWNQDRRRNV